MIAFFRARFGERSTWLGIGAAGAGSLQTVGAYLTPDQAHLIAVVSVFAGIMAVIVPERA